MVDLIAGLASLKQGMEILAALNAIGKEYDQATLKLKIAELATTVSNATIALTDANLQISELRKENERLTQSFAERLSLVTVGEYKYKSGFNGTPIGYPICPNCELTAGLIVKTVRNGAFSQAKCPVCDKIYEPVDSFRHEDGRSRLEIDRETRERKAAVTNAKLRYRREHPF